MPSTLLLPDTDEQLKAKIVSIVDSCVTQSDNTDSLKFMEQFSLPRWVTHLFFCSTSSLIPHSKPGLYSSYGSLQKPKKTMSGRANMQIDLQTRFEEFIKSKEQLEKKEKEKEKETKKEKEKEKEEEGKLKNWTKKNPKIEQLYLLLNPTPPPLSPHHPVAHNNRQFSVATQHFLLAADWSMLPFQRAPPVSGHIYRA